MSRKPKCFISYSWDSQEHINWVKKFARDLELKYIDVLADFRDLKLGMNLPEYMELSIRSSDYILAICTPEYARKSNELEGGVGYEKSIISGRLIDKLISPIQVVPIIKIGEPIHATPDYLRGKWFLSFLSDDDYNDNFERLLAHIYDDSNFTRPTHESNPNFDNLIPNRLPDINNEQLSNHAFIKYSSHTTIKSYKPNPVFRPVNIIDGINSGDDFILELWIDNVTAMTTWEIQIDYDPECIQRIDFSIINLKHEQLFDIPPILFNILQINSPVVFGNKCKYGDSPMATEISRDNEIGKNLQCDPPLYSVIAGNTFVPAKSDPSQMAHGEGLAVIYAFGIKPELHRKHFTEINVSRFRWNSNNGPILHGKIPRSFKILT